MRKILEMQLHILYMESELWGSTFLHRMQWKNIVFSITQAQMQELMLGGGLIF